ncbi:MAG: VIT1/CCC1 transporter family protein [Fusobacteriaceae bacterium]
MIAEKEVKKYQALEKLHWNLYIGFSQNEKRGENKAILEELSIIEKRHYRELTKILGSECEISRAYLKFLIKLGKVLGIRFVIKYVERKENRVKGKIISLYKGEKKAVPELFMENDTEKEAINKLYDEKLLYVSAILLGMNDAMVEFSGALAGYTLAIEDTKMIGVIGMITGIAAALSMSIAEYMAVKEDEKSHLKCNRAAVYTGIAYIIAVSLLVFPYFLEINRFFSLGLMVSVDVFLVFIFNYYVAITTEVNLWKKFSRMTLIVLSVAFISFIIGYLAQIFLGVKI